MTYSHQTMTYLIQALTRAVSHITVDSRPGFDSRPEQSRFGALR